jgi:hypothetical protein
MPQTSSPGPLNRAIAAAPFLTTIRPRPRSHRTPIPYISLCLLPVVSRPRVGNHRLVGTPPAAASKATFSEFQCIPFFLVHVAHASKAICAKNVNASWRVVSSANAVSVGRTMAQRANSWLVFFSLTLSSCVFVVLIGQTLNSREECVRASSKQFAYRLYGVGDDSSPCVRLIYTRNLRAFRSPACILFPLIHSSIFSGSI